MANDLNQCNFIGRLGKDIEMRYSPDGKAIANFSIAVGESWKNKQTGQKQEKTTWVNIVIFGKLAEIAGEYLQKGSKIFVSGKFSVQKWQDNNGNDKYTTSITLDSFNGTMQMLDGRNDNQNGQQNQAQQGYNANQKQQQPQQQPQQQQHQQAKQNGYQPQQGDTNELDDELDEEIPF